MHTSPWNVLSSHVAAGVLTDGWSLDTVDHENAESLRCHRVPVQFATPFTSPPVVQLGLTGFDLDQRDSARLSVRAEEITAGGFEAVISTWAETRVYGVDFQWFAIGA